VSSVDDVTDLRTRLIYASLQDEELVRQLTRAQIVRDRRSRRAPRAHGEVVDVRDDGDVIDPDVAARLSGYYLG
jgi:hypothetical protein